MSRKNENTAKGKLVGILAGTALGAVLGVGYVYVVKLTGKDHR